MDLRALSSLSKVSIFKKLGYISVVKVRKTCKRLDNFVETHRHEIVKYHGRSVYFNIILEKEDSEVEIEFSVATYNGPEEIRTQLSDPYKQLSAVAFEYVSVDNSATRENLFGKELEDCLLSDIFPLLKKMRLICQCFLTSELNTGHVLVLAKYIRCTEFKVCSDTGYHEDLNPVAIVAYPFVQKSERLMLDNCLPEAFPPGMLKNFTTFSYVELSAVQTTFIMGLVENLYDLPDLGNLRQIVIKITRAIFDDSNIPWQQSHLLFGVGHFPNNFMAVRLFYRARKWIFCVCVRNINTPENQMYLTFMEQDLSILVDKLLELSHVGDGIDASSIRHQFVNAPKMESYLPGNEESINPYEIQSVTHSFPYRDEDPLSQTHFPSRLSKMLVSFRAHLTSGFLNIISLIFTGIALFTCHWMDFKDYSISNVAGSGLFNPSGFSTTCATWREKPSWLSTTIAFMIIAFALQIIQTLHVLATSVYRRYNDHVLKVDSALMTISFASLLIGVVVYGISAYDYFDDYTSFNSYWLGWSYIMACIATCIALMAMGPVGHALKKIRDCGDCECRATYW